MLVANMPAVLEAPAFTIEQVDLIKRTICVGATDSELEFFLYQCRRTRLDPLTRQIYSVPRRQKIDGQWKTTRTTQTSIDGFRLIAERTGKYAGQRGPFWCGPDGQWTDVWLDGGTPSAAKVGVLRHDWTEPAWAVALFSEYEQTYNDNGKRVLTQMWEKMPALMIAKCAEALALRKAFPQELSGLYTSDELQHGGATIDAAPASTDDVRIDTYQPTAPAPGAPPKSEPAPQKKARRTWADWLDDLEAELGGCEAEDEVNEIVGREQTRKATETLRNGAADRLNKMIRDAYDRVVTNNAPPLDDEIAL